MIKRPKPPIKGSAPVTAAPARQVSKNSPILAAARARVAAGKARVAAIKKGVHPSHPMKFGALEFDVEPIAVASARNSMPGLILASANMGRAFLIRNAKSASAASALLIDPKVLEQRLSSMKPRRTLGELIDALPFRQHDAPRVVARLPNDEAPTLRISGQVIGEGKGQRAEENLELNGPEAEIGA